MATWLATKPIVNRRFNLKAGDPIPKSYSTPEAIKQLKALHGEDCVKLVDYNDPNRKGIGDDPLVLDALEGKVAEQEKQIRDLKDHSNSMGEMIGAQHKRIEALEAALKKKPEGGDAPQQLAPRRKPDPSMTRRRK